MKDFMNIYSDDYINNPYKYYQILLESKSIYTISPGIHVICKYEDVSKILLMNTLYRDVYNKSTKIYQDSYRKKMTKYDFLLHLDPPKHTRIRKSVSKYFNKSYTKNMLEIIDKRTYENISKLDSKSYVNVLESVAKKIPLESIIEILGLPEHDYDKLSYWSEKISHAVEPQASEEDLVDILNIFEEFYEYIEKLIKNNKLKFGLISDMLQETDEQQLNVFDIICSSILMFEAGHQTSTALISNMLYLMSVNHRELNKLLGNKNFSVNYVNETLRFESPVQQTVRAVNEDCSIELSYGNIDFFEGDILVILMGAANRDPDVFPDPNSFNIERPHVPKHLSYAAGAHHCLGHILANHQGKCLIDYLLNRFNKFDIIDNISWKKTLTSRIPEKLIMEFKNE